MDSYDKKKRLLEQGKVLVFNPDWYCQVPYYERKEFCVELPMQEVPLVVRYVDADFFLRQVFDGEVVDEVASRKQGLELFMKHRDYYLNKWQGMLTSRQQAFKNLANSTVLDETRTVLNRSMTDRRKFKREDYF